MGYTIGFDPQPSHHNWTKLLSRLLNAWLDAFPRVASRSARPSDAREIARFLQSKGLRVGPIYAAIVVDRLRQAVEHSPGQRLGPVQTLGCIALPGLSPCSCNPDGSCKGRCAACVQRGATAMARPDPSWKDYTKIPQALRQQMASSEATD